MRAVDDRVADKCDERPAYLDAKHAQGIVALHGTKKGCTRADCPRLDEAQAFLELLGPVNGTR